MPASPGSASSGSAAPEAAAAKSAAITRILVCPQEFKGSLTAAEATAAIAAGVRDALPVGSSIAVVEQPMADGGPGTVELIRAARGGELVEVEAHGPLGEPLTAAYALLPATERDAAEGGAAAGEAAGGEGASAPSAPSAVIEAAATAGLVLVPPQQRDPGRATTCGVGEQIMDAARRGARRVVVGVGGTGTNDGGAGALEALGYRLLDEHDAALPPGGLALARLARIEAGQLDPALRTVTLVIATDVTNRLLGPEGASMTYGAQKGASIETMLALEAALTRWAQVLHSDLGVPVEQLEGGGAGGGLAAGLAATATLTGAHIEPGAALVGAEVGLLSLIEEADLVITGEGRLDAQTAYGKTVSHVAELAAAAGRPCLAVAGRIEGVPEGLAATEPAAPPDIPEAEAITRASELVQAAAARLTRHWLESRGG